MPLPHAKVDSAVDRVAPLAFGSDHQAGGHKFLIFTRRVSTVDALRERLVRRHRLAIERRVQRYWNVPRLDWENGPNDPEETDAVDDDSDPEASEVESERDLLRLATAKGGWLHRYRQTFRTSGRNALFFEDGLA